MKLRMLMFRFKMAWYGFTYPAHATTLQKINKQLEDGTRMGVRGTPVISFWPAKKGWGARYAKENYWEGQGSDGDELIAGGIHFEPAFYRLIYFRIPGTDLVCQLAFERQPGTATAWDDHSRQIDYVTASQIREVILSNRKVA